MREEIWQPITDYESYYEASSHGRIRSLDRTIVQQGRWGLQTRVMRGRVLKLSMGTGGYLIAGLSMDNTCRTRLVHQLVCEAFHGARPVGMSHTRHLDGDRCNNRADNLRWGTPSENMLDMIAHGSHWQAAKTHCLRGHEFTEENTLVRPSRNVDGRSTRECITCQREAAEAGRAWRLENDPTYHPPGSDCCRYGHPYTPENSRYVTGRLTGEKYRRCRRCMNDAKMKSAAKRKCAA